VRRRRKVKGKQSRERTVNEDERGERVRYVEEGEVD